MMDMKMAQVKYDAIRLAGGLDLLTPTLSLKPGVLREATNFEVSPFGGYSRISGYERVDGRPSPSGAAYSVYVVSLTATVSVGDTVTGATSAHHGLVIATPDATTIVCTKESGALTVGETITVGGSSKGTVVSIGAATYSARASAQYQKLASNAYRADIQAVPGSGPVRGVAYFNSKVYAWRNNVAGTSLGMYVSSASGWTAVPLGIQLYFGTGTSKISVGDTITGVTSGATAVVTHLTVQKGDWSVSTAQGLITVASVAGGPFHSGEVLNVGGTSHAATTTVSSAVTLSPGGRLSTISSTFGGYAEEQALYGADGVNRAFEFYDSGIYVPIDTGNAVDNPSQLAAHKNHLFLVYGSSLQHSAPGEPHQWQAILGAGEIACDDTITNLLEQPGSQATGAMAVYTRNGTNILYGTGLASWNFVSYNIGTGALAYTAQNMNNSYVLDDRGVMSLVTSLNYGNFESTALTFPVQPWIQQRRNITTDSCVNREKSQYRVFFSDGSGLYLTILNGNMMGAMPVEFPDSVVCITEGETTGGFETSFFGSTNGFIYALDIGNSFDGAQISANMLLTYSAEGSSRILKRYRKGSLEVSGNGYAEFDFSYVLGYADTNIGQAPPSTTVSSLIPSYWDTAIWDSFIWDGRSLAPSEVEVNGTAENIAVRIASNSDFVNPFTINSVILHYTPRRGIR